jgi:outer membrane protein OmpA-like peptidoglycan-associated protein
MKNINYTLLLLLLTGSALPTQALEYATALQVTVNSNQDEIRPDAALTLREAIALVNGQLSIDRLSTAEKAQVKMAVGVSRSRIGFQLPKGKQRIELKSALPNVIKKDVVIEGSTTTPAQMGNIVFNIPTVEITSAAGVQIDRGLALMADNITVKGLSIHGFQVGLAPSTQNLPGADILVGTNLNGQIAPRNILIENNFLGVTTGLQIPDRTSDFGVYVFNSQGTSVRHNAIGHHSASGIISQINANNLLVTNNAIFGNGYQGMPDAIRLEGNLVNNQIKGNLICGNDGSGIYIFKPESGHVQITDNQIQSNGRRLRRAAIHLMGDNHQVSNNSIEFQNGSGVAVTAFPHQGGTSAVRNQITNNRFQKLEGLSVDLITDRNLAVEDFQNGDGVNPTRNSDNRRLDTGNGAINAPRFLDREFYLINNHVNLDGLADPGSEVEIYQVYDDGNNNGPLSKPLQKVTADAQGKFQATFQNLPAGTVLSAIASDRRYGTSEPAANVIVTRPGVKAIATPSYPLPGNCSLVAVPAGTGQIPTVPSIPPVTPIPPAITKIAINRNVHFALDKSNISPASAQVLQGIIQVLKANPYISIDLAGHTDPRAPQAYNQALGMRRAIAVRNYLLKQGIAPQRMTIRSFGFSKRRSNERGVQPYALDRRVEFEYRDLRGGELEIIDLFEDLQPEK